MGSATGDGKSLEVGVGALESMTVSSTSRFGPIFFVSKGSPLAFDVVGEAKGSESNRGHLSRKGHG